MSRYTDEEIEMFDGVLSYLKVHGSYNLNRMPGVRQPAEINRKFIEKTVVGSGLGIVGIDRFTCFLTDEGRKAAETGFRAYIEGRERKETAPPVVIAKEENRPWWKLNKNETLTLATLLVTLFFGLRSCWG